MDYIDLLLGYYNKSDEKDIYHNVAGAVLTHLNDVQDANIYDLADMCYSSPSTISRFMKKMRFSSYADFKSNIQYALQNHQHLNRNMKEINFPEDSDVVPLYFDALSDQIMMLREAVTYEQIAGISDAMSQAEKVMFFSFTESQIDTLQKSVIMYGKQTVLYSGILNQESILQDVTPGTLIFAMMAEFPELLPLDTIMKKAKEKGAAVVSVCSERQNLCFKYSDIQIAFAGTGTSMDLYLFMIVVNLIKNDFSRRYLTPMIEEQHG